MNWNKSKVKGEKRTIHVRVRHEQGASGRPINSNDFTDTIQSGWSLQQILGSFMRRYPDARSIDVTWDTTESQLRVRTHDTIDQDAIWWFAATKGPRNPVPNTVSL